jgi:type VI secretion system secreted protein Hcp
MPFDAFLKIDGIPGESTDDKHKDWIQILSFSMGITHPGTLGQSGAVAAARADFHDFSIVKLNDKCSPKLSMACAKGERIKEIKLDLCHAGGDKFKFMEYKMNDCAITSWKPGGTPYAANPLPVEEVTFNYHKIEWTYSQMKRPDGSGGGNVASNWDLMANKGA